MKIKLITLKTNHTLLGNIEEKTDVVLVKSPVQVISIPPKTANDQSMGIAFAPFLEYCQEFKSGIELQRADILAITTPVVELENQYNSVFGSGIQIAKSL